MSKTSKNIAINCKQHSGFGLIKLHLVNYICMLTTKISSTQFSTTLGRNKKQSQLSFTLTCHKLLVFEYVQQNLLSGKMSLRIKMFQLITIYKKNIYSVNHTVFASCFCCC